MEGSKKRISLDVIKIVAICFVIYNHTGENGYELFRYAEKEWIRCLAIFLDVICKSGVPLFFMVSGALLLGREESFKVIFLKRVLRYVVILLFFSFLYYVRLYVLHPEYGFSLVFFAKYIYSTPFITPFWFLYLYIEFLIMLPLLRAIVKSIDIRGYVLVIVLMFVMDYIAIPEYLFEFGHINMSFGLLESNIAYPIIGYGIANVYQGDMLKKRNKGRKEEEYFSTSTRRCFVLAVLLLMNFASSFVMNYVEFNKTGEYSGKFIDNFSYIPAITVFTFIIYLFEIKEITVSDRISWIVEHVGGCTIGIYLFEEALRDDIFLRIFQFNENQMGGLILCIPYTAGIVICGVGLSFLLRKVPVLNRLKI